MALLICLLVTNRLDLMGLNYIVDAARALPFLIAHRISNWETTGWSL